MRLLRRIWFAITHRRQDDDLAEEMRLHREMTAEAMRRDGIAEDEIQSAVQRRLGNDLVARERSRDVWIAPWFQDIGQDLRLAWRVLTHERRFALTAMLTLGLGMAVSNTGFHFVYAAMFRDLPFERPDRLLTIRTLDPRGFSAGVSYPEYRQWREHTTAFEILAADSSQSVNISDDQHGAERLSGSYVTHDSFRMVRVSPILGRDFSTDDDREGAPPVVILSYGLWQGRYGGDPQVVGRIVRISGQPATVIGVMPEGFSYPLVTDIWLPMAMTPGLRNATWVSTGIMTIGRLRDGVTREQARAEVEAVAAVTVREHPEVKKDRKLSVAGIKETQLAYGATDLLWSFLAATIVVLLLASANVTNLLLARAWQHSREIAVRAALGASRWLIECALIGAGGALLGGYLSFAGFEAMSSAFNVFEAGAPERPRKPYWFDANVDGFGWVFMAAMFLFGTLAAGLIPALHLSKTDANLVLVDGRDGQATRVSRRWASALMAAQIAVALMLLSAGGLFVRSFIELSRTDPVIAVDGLVSMRLTFPARVASRDDRLQFVRRLDERLQNNAEFTESAIASDVPVQTAFMLSRSVLLEGEVRDPSAAPRTAIYVAAGPRLFGVLQFPLTSGRALTEADERPGQEAAVVNQRFAALFFGDASPIGKRIQLAQAGAASNPPPAWLTIVGVVPTIPDFNANRPDDPVVYAPLLGDPTPARAISVMVRSRSKAAAAAALRHEVAALDPDLPVYAVQTLDEVVGISRIGVRMVGSWFQTLAVIAVLLSAVGLYALTAHGVAQRRREIGVRMTLGARAGQVVSMFAWQTARIVAIGTLVGLLAALSVNRVLAGFLGGVSPRDPLTFATVTIILVAVALAAAVVPARRAARIDPVNALRAD
jgi:putative ABC transport system permease protein